MITAKEREAAFREDLQALMEKHGAELELDDDGKPYGLASWFILVTMQPVYDAVSDEQLAAFTEFRL